MTWLIAAISAYFILAIVFLIDKYLLVQKIPDPKVYSFYIGGLGILILFLVPFVDFILPEPPQMLLAFLAGAVFIYGLFWFFKGLQLFEASRVVPAIGGILPLFSLGLTYLFSGGKETLGSSELSAFFLLILGSILITYEKSKGFPLKSLTISVLAALFLALSFVLSKYVYLNQPFWSGYILIRSGGVFTAGLFFIFFKEVRGEVIKTKQVFPKKTAALVLFNQSLGVTANVLQNWAIALASLAFVAVINALQGTQYVFLLALTAFLSLKFPQILKEEISRKILFQKIFAILLIGGGLALLVIS